MLWFSPDFFFLNLYLFIFLFFYQTQLGPYIKVKNCEQNASIVKILLWLNGAKPLLKTIDQALNQATTTTKQTKTSKQNRWDVDICIAKVAWNIENDEDKHEYWQAREITRIWETKGFEISGDSGTRRDMP